MQFFFPESVCTRVWIGIAAVGLGLLILGGCSSSPSTASEPPTPVGKSVPRTNPPLPPVDAGSNAGENRYGWTLIDNRRMKLSDYSGRVVVLDFWATDCPPCLDEVPFLVGLQGRLGTQGLQIIGLNVGSSDDQSRVSAFADRFKIQYPLGYPEKAMKDLYLSSESGIPQTLVFDRKGKLVKHFFGFDAQVSKELERVVQEALSAGT